MSAKVNRPADTVGSIKRIRPAQRKSIQLTKFGQRVMEELARLHSMFFYVITDERGFSSRQTKGHERAKAEALEQLRAEVISSGYSLPEGKSVDDIIHCDAEDPAVENAEYSEYLGRALSEMVLCRGVDHYHWYLRRVVLMILERDNSVLRPWAKELGIKDAEMSKFERGENRERLLVSWFRGKEWRTRDLVHKYWRMPLGEDLSVLAKIRNCLVHQFGEDADGEIARLLSGNSRIYAKGENGQVTVGFGGAYEAELQRISGPRFV